jgi:alpha-mannosidase
MSPRSLGRLSRFGKTLYSINSTMSFVRRQSASPSLYFPPPCLLFSCLVAGSSIGMVYEDSSRMLESVMSLSSEHIQNLMKIFSAHATFQEGGAWLYNPAPIQRTHHLPSTSQSITLNPFSIQETPLSSTLAEDSIPISKAALKIKIDGINCLSDVYLTDQSSSSLSQYVMGNEFVEVMINERGAIISFLDKRTSPPRQVLLQSSIEKEGSEGKSDGGLMFANNLMLYDDVPLFWDAWDVMPYHLMTGNSLNDFQHTSGTNKERIHSSFEIKTLSSEEVSVEIKLSHWGGHEKSNILMTITLTKFSPRLDFKLSIDWHESHKILKAEFPLGLQSNVARYETQFGYTDRPTHGNHATDAAMFETCGHRYASLSEPGYGIALLNNSKYGHSCRDSTLCLSLLRAPKSPDPNCDMGTHVIQYALYPHLGSFLDQESDSGVISEAILYNTPLIKMISSDSGSTDSHSYVASISPSFGHLLRSGIFALTQSARSTLVLDTIKLAEGCGQQSKCEVILRFYESLGARGNAMLDCLISPSSASFTSLNEITLSPSHQLEGEYLENGTTRYSLPYKPFQIITLKLGFL